MTRRKVKDYKIEYQKDFHGKPVYWVMSRIGAKDKFKIEMGFNTRKRAFNYIKKQANNVYGKYYYIIKYNGIRLN